MDSSGRCGELFWIKSAIVLSWNSVSARLAILANHQLYPCWEKSADFILFKSHRTSTTYDRSRLVFRSSGIEISVSSATTGRVHKSCSKRPTSTSTSMNKVPWNSTVSRLQNPLCVGQMWAGSKPRGLSWFSFWFSTYREFLKVLTVNPCHKVYGIFVEFLSNTTERN